MMFEKRSPHSLSTPQEPFFSFPGSMSVFSKLLILLSQGLLANYVLVGVAIRWLQKNGY